MRAVRGDQAVDEALHQVRARRARRPCRAPAASPRARPRAGSRWRRRPPRRGPTPGTAPARGSTRRDSASGRPVATVASTWTRSTVLCGREVWPPGPVSVTLRASAAAVIGPDFSPMRPDLQRRVAVQPEHRGDASSQPSASTSSAPPGIISSAGWNTRRTVPSSPSAASASARPAPSTAARVDVVAARVADPVDLRPVGHVLLVVERQRVDVGAQDDHGPLAPADVADQAGADSSNLRRQPRSGRAVRRAARWCGAPAGRARGGRAGRGAAARARPRGHAARRRRRGFRSRRARRAALADDLGGVARGQPDRRARRELREQAVDHGGQVAAAGGRDGALPLRTTPALEHLLDEVELRRRSPSRSAVGRMSSTSSRSASRTGCTRRPRRR